MAEIKNTNKNYDTEAMKASLTPERKAFLDDVMHNIVEDYGDTMRALAGQEVTFENGVTVNKPDDN